MKTEFKPVTRVFDTLCHSKVRNKSGSRVVNRKRNAELFNQAQKKWNNMILNKRCTKECGK